MRKILLVLVRMYQLTIRPLLGANCRFYPSCSEYAQEALTKLPLSRALWLILKRLLRCAGWSRGGVDLVPDSSVGNLELSSGRESVSSKTIQVFKFDHVDIKPPGD
jgi:putative membrane protein insertion efficiency factor